MDKAYIGGGEFTESYGLDSRVFDFLLFWFLVVVGEQYGDVVTQQTEHQRDQNNRQDHPHTNVRVEK